MFKDFLTGLLDLIYPPLCVLCKTPLSRPGKDGQLCPRCQSTVEKTRPPFCRKCSRPMEYPEASFCPACQRTRHAFDQAWGACRYNETMRRLLHMFKYGNKTVLRHYFSGLISEFIETWHVDIRRFDLIVPVPLHATRQRERGYNQALLVARLIAERWDIPLSADNLIRVRNTKNQAVLSQKERWTNIQGAFKIKHSSVFRDKNVLAIDDLFTTGATASELARVMKEAGAGNVSVLTVAIA